MTDPDKINTDQTKELKFATLFHGCPPPKNWIVEKAAAQWAKIPGKVYSGREVWSNHPEDTASRGEKYVW